jgi:hypothetical protein
LVNWGWLLITGFGGMFFGFIIAAIAILSAAENNKRRD